MPRSRKDRVSRRRCVAWAPRDSACHRPCAASQEWDSAATAPGAAWPRRPQRTLLASSFHNLLDGGIHVLSVCFRANKIDQVGIGLEHLAYLDGPRLSVHLGVIYRDLDFQTPEVHSPEALRELPEPSGNSIRSSVS